MRQVSAVPRVTSRSSSRGMCAEVFIFAPCKCIQWGKVCASQCKTQEPFCWLVGNEMFSCRLKSPSAPGVSDVGCLATGRDSSLTVGAPLPGWGLGKPLGPSGRCGSLTSLGPNRERKVIEKQNFAVRGLTQLAFVLLYKTYYKMASHAPSSAG